MSLSLLKLVFVEFFYFREIWFVGHSVDELQFVSDKASSDSGFVDCQSIL